MVKLKPFQDTRINRGFIQHLNIKDNIRNRISNSENKRYNNIKENNETYKFNANKNDFFHDNNKDNLIDKVISNKYINI